MRVRYLHLCGKTVRTSDGWRVGRVTDLLAEGQGEELYVTALLVGPIGFVRRIAFAHHPFPRMFRTLRVPWSLVAELDGQIHLLVDRAELNAVMAEERGTHMERAADRRERSA